MPASVLSGAGLWRANFRVSMVSHPSFRAMFLIYCLDLQVYVHVIDRPCNANKLLISETTSYLLTLISDLLITCAASYEGNKAWGVYSI